VIRPVLLEAGQHSLIHTFGINSRCRQLTGRLKA